eukprot:391253_1
MQYFIFVATIVFCNNGAQALADVYNTKSLVDQLSGQTGGIDMNIRERRSVPQGCSSNAVGGNCKSCNGDGCSSFRCSAFTTWSCPDGTEQCGSKTCQGG